MTQLERPMGPKPQEKTFRVRLTPNQIEFLIHILRAYSNLRSELQIRQQSELHFLVDEFRKGGGYQILQLRNKALEDSKEFQFCHPGTIANKALAFADLFERILEGGRPKRTWRYKNPLRDFKPVLVRHGTRNKNPQAKRHIKVEQ